MPPTASDGSIMTNEDESRQHAEVGFFQPNLS
jgi:hypothetical protein